MPSKVIAHVDMDAFFASVEQRDNPLLRGQPVVVGANPKDGRGRGVVSTCSYEARKYGIHSAMPISTAYARCPTAIFLPVDMDRYQRASQKIFKILYDFTPDIEPISVDEAFLDLTGCYHFYQTPNNTARTIKERIKKETGLTASVGIAPVKFVAKIASDMSKPDGFLEIVEGNLLEFLWPLSIEKLWGVGPKSKLILNSLKIETIKDLAHAPIGLLSKHFGESGRHLYDLANGIDERSVEIQDEVKSVSHEHTFERDTSNKEIIYETLLDLSERVSRRLRQDQLQGKTITLKIRLAGFKTFTRAATLFERTNFTDTIYKKSRELFNEFHKPSMKIRLLGVRVSHFLDAYIKESLFEDKNSARLEKIHKAVDAIKDKFGEGAIGHAKAKSLD